MPTQAIRAMALQVRAAPIRNRVGAIQSGEKAATLNPPRQF
jgi:hypothetical protein